jgi:aryl-alcohol dehydrogenase-like predicted oxidoreductase
MGGDQDIWGLVDDRESIAAIQHALDAGVNLIDTAPIYGRGHSEEIVGKAIQGRRKEVALATKCGLLMPTTKGSLPPRCLKRESIIQECEASLRRLRVDVIDLYQCHWPDPATPIRETMEALTSLQKLGKIRLIGLSNFGVDQITAAREFGPVHTVQIAFSLLNPRAAEDLIPFCREHDIAVLAYSSLGRGLLTGKFNPESRFEDIRARDPEFTGRRFSRNLQLVDQLRPIAQRYGKTVAQVALNWVLNTPGLTAALCGAKRPSQVRENLGADGWKLSDDDRREIDQFLKATP